MATPSTRHDSGSPTIKTAVEVALQMKITLPPDIIDIILAYCDQLTSLNVLKTCKSCNDVAVPHVYRTIVLNSPRQLRNLIRTSELAMHDDRVKAQFYHTRAFHYCIPQGSTATSTTKVKDVKLYLMLRDICHQTSDGLPIFPNLATASFDQLPMLNIDLPYKPSFLSLVSTVHLTHSQTSTHDSPPHFHGLGMSDVRELHLYHLAGVEVNGDTELASLIGYQACLVNVYLHLSEHFDFVLCGTPGHALGARMHIVIDGILQPVGPPPPTSNFSDAVYIREYGTGVGVAAANLAFATRVVRSQRYPIYPNLRRVIIDIGQDAPASGATLLESNSSMSQAALPSTSDRQILLKRCKKQLSKWMEHVIKHQRQASHLPGAAVSTIASMPDIYLRQGDKGPACILSGKTTQPSASTDITAKHATWEEIK